MSTTVQPRVGLVDTDPVIEQLIIATARRQPLVDRVAQLEAHTAELRQLSWAALQQTRADLSPTERLRLWLAVQYGTDLADRVLAYCAARGR